MELRKLAVLVVLVIGVISVGVSVVVSAQVQKPTPTAQRSIGLSDNALETQTPEPGHDLTADNTVRDPQTEILRSVYQRVNPSVVSISVRTADNNGVMGSPFGQPDLLPYAYAARSGFVYDAQGHIVTNAHVVDGADHIVITFNNGTMHSKLVGIDRDSDIAVLEAQGDVSRYQPVPLADSDYVEVGDLVIAIGNPFEQSGTMTRGIVSGLHRPIQALTQTADGKGTYTIPEAIQTDAAINPGNSGGPLLNAQGQVIGVNDQIESQVRQSSGVSFAIPSNIVRLVADTLIKDGKIEHTWLGIAGQQVSLDLIEAMNLPENTRGVYVSAVQSGGPAFKAGLIAGEKTSHADGPNMVVGGDIITAIDNYPLNTFEDLTFIHTRVGQTVSLTVLRDARTHNIKVDLAARPHGQSQS